MAVLSTEAFSGAGLSFEEGGVGARTVTGIHNPATKLLACADGLLNELCTWPTAAPRPQ